MTKPGLEDAMNRLDRGLAYAEACFETFRVIDGHVFAWQAHMMRLRKGLAEFGITLPQGLRTRCLKVAAKAGAEDTLLRLTVTGGVAAWGLAPPAQRQPGVYVQAIPYQPRQKPVELHAMAWPFSVRPRVAKFTSDYAESLRILHTHAREACTGDMDVIVCDNQQFYTGITANVLVYREGCWWTPGTEAILQGVIRNHLVNAGAVNEAVCPVSWLVDCTAMALTNSVAFVQPVSRVNGRLLAPPDSPVFELLWRHLEGKPGVPKERLCG